MFRELVCLKASNPDTQTGKKYVVGIFWDEKKVKGSTINNQRNLMPKIPRLSEDFRVPSPSNRI